MGFFGASVSIEFNVTYFLDTCGSFTFTSSGLLWCSSDQRYGHFQLL